LKGAITEDDGSRSDLIVMTHRPQTDEATGGLTPRLR
jgi:hypothetical protein